MSCSRTCAGLSVLQFKAFVNFKRWSLRQRSVLCFWVEELLFRVTLRMKVIIQSHRFEQELESKCCNILFCFDLKHYAGIYVVESIMSIAGQDAKVAAVIDYLVESRKHARDCQK